ncbi:hypothetical protein ACFSWE_09440 [Leucobacter albus]|uniref:Uncharacterized protein n=1 Tax=Leucobacter albus TaxID=272210 RepID=A0ABW3TU76_9MICO
MCVFSWGNLNSWATVVGGLFTLATFVATLAIARNTLVLTRRAEGEAEARRNEDVAREKARMSLEFRSEKITRIREHKRDIKLELNSVLEAHDYWQRNAASLDSSVEPLLERIALLVNEIILAGRNPATILSLGDALTGHGFFTTQFSALKAHGHIGTEQLPSDADACENWLLGEMNGMLDVVKDSVFEWDLTGNSAEHALLPRDFWTAALGPRVNVRGKFRPPHRPPRNWYELAEERWLPQRGQPDQLVRLRTLIHYRVIAEYSMRRQLVMRRLDEEAHPGHAPNVEAFLATYYASVSGLLVAKLSAAVYEELGQLDEDLRALNEANRGEEARLAAA